MIREKMGYISSPPKHADDYVSPRNARSKSGKKVRIADK